MPREVDPAYSVHLQQLQEMLPWIWLLGLQTTEAVPRRYRITNYTQQVQWGEDSEGNPHIYYPVPVELGAVKVQSDGSLPEIDVNLGLGGPLVASTFDDSAGFTGSPLDFFLVDTNNLSSPKPAYQEQGEVVGATVSTDGVSLRVSGGSLFEMPFPNSSYSRTGCTKWRGNFAGPGCGYNIDAPNAGFSGCGVLNDGTVVAPPFTMEACVAVGADEESNPSIAVARHPARFGGFPGMRSSR